MAKEIERKFLVISDNFINEAVSSREISQGYLCTNPDATVRVRISGREAWLTVKSRNHGATRGEWEYPVPVDDARRMITECCGGCSLEKTRYIVPATEAGLQWEVDVFHGHHEGLILAEIELPAEDTSFTLPSFVGKEVTGDTRYYNSVLIGG